jgi:hypothetical protein
LAAAAAEELDMHENAKRTLKLSRETIRILSSDEMAKVAGGWWPTITWACATKDCPTNACESGLCPAPPLTSPGHCTNGCTIAVVGRRI